MKPLPKKSPAQRMFSGMAGSPLAVVGKPAPVAVAVLEPEPVPAPPAPTTPMPKPCGGCGQERCRYCHPEKQVQTANLSGRHTGKWAYKECGCLETESCIHTSSPENNTTTPDPTHKEIVARFGGIYLPGILQLSRVALTRLLNTPIGFRTEPDHTQPPQKIFKSPAETKTQLAEMTAELAPMKIRIEELKKLISETQDTILGLGKKVMERRRKDHPDDPLLHDENTREQLLNEEKNKLVTYNREKQEIETSRRSMWQKIGVLQHALDIWESTPANFELKPVMREVPIPFEEEFEPPDVKYQDGKFRYVDLPDAAPFDGFLLPGYEFGVAAYRELVEVYDVDNQTNNKKSGVWRRWMRFENEIIIQAYRRHLIEIPKWA